MTDLTAVTESDAFEAARRIIHDSDATTVSHMCEATRIAAPTGSEAERGRWLAARFRELSLEPRVDDAGNVIAVSPAAERETPRVVLASHLDTVFAAGTALDIIRDGVRISAPGISDNSRGLAGLLAVARALAGAGWPTRAPIAFVGTVGEEGAGDLRGAKHYMERNGAGTAAFIALDGAGSTRIIHAGVGSRRLRVTFRGPGGHSWSDFGRPNAVHTAGRAVTALTALPLPADPRTTLTVARIGGGTSINTIPAEAWLELDLRSEERRPLAEIEARVRAVLDRTAADESSADDVISCDTAVFGDRPPGATAASDPLVRVAEAATRAIGLEPQLAGSSTDANIAMSIGIPAIAVGSGGTAGGTHTLGEWYENEGGAHGIERVLLIVLATAGLAQPPDHRP
ncbi:M20/M25/M40 family metallo-hydrolase [soil metagenome]